MLLLETFFFFQQKICRTYVLQQIFLFKSSVQRETDGKIIFDLLVLFKQNYKGVLVCAGVSISALSGFFL